MSRQHEAVVRINPANLPATLRWLILMKALCKTSPSAAWHGHFWRELSANQALPNTLVHASLIAQQSDSSVETIVIEYIVNTLGDERLTAGMSCGSRNLTLSGRWLTKGV